MPSTKLRFPIEVVLKISELLLFQECFIELESALYYFPQLTKHFCYRFPTIVIVNTQQYDKYVKFIHTRERPFGSKDLFIIKEENFTLRDRNPGLKTKCYMVLGSKPNQERVPKGFKDISHYVTLVENKALNSLCCDSSSRCYELICDPKEEDVEWFGSAGYLYLSKPLGFQFSPFHVTLLLKMFLKEIQSPCSIRFENYLEGYDLSIGYEQLCQIYNSVCSFRSPGDLVPARIRLPITKDTFIKSLKCSFELIRDINNFTSLYEYSISKGVNSYDQFDQDLCKFAGKKSFKLSKLLYSLLKPSKVEIFSLFRNVKDVTIERIPSQESNYRKYDFISIDCSRAAISNSIPFQFILNYVSTFDSGIPRLNTGKSSIKVPETLPLSDKVLKLRAGLPESLSLPCYAEIVCKSFLVEQLQSVDITAFNPTSKTIRTTDEKKYGRVESNESTLKDLECQINCLVRFISKLFMNKEDPQPKKITELSQKVMSTIIRETSSVEGLSENQPFRLRMFHKNSHYLNRPEEAFYLDEWFRKNTTLCSDNVELKL